MQYCDFICDFTCVMLHYLHHRLFSGKPTVISPWDLEQSCRFLILSILGRFNSATFWKVPLSLILLSFLLPIHSLIWDCAVTVPVVECNEASVPKWALPWPQTAPILFREITPAWVEATYQVQDVHGTSGAPLLPWELWNLFNSTWNVRRTHGSNQQDSPFSYPLTVNDSSVSF